MLLAAILTLGEPVAIQRKAPPLYMPLVGRTERPLEEFVHYRARCEGFDVDVRYRVQRPVGSVMLALESNKVSLSAGQLFSLNVALKDRFITGVSTGFCYIPIGGKAKVNLWLEIDAVGSKKLEASHIVLNIDGNNMTILFRRSDGNESVHGR